MNTTGNRYQVTVEADEVQIVPGRQQRLAVPSPADGGVDQDAGGHRCEESHHLVAQDRDVGKRVGHLQLLERREGRRIEVRTS